MAILATVAFNSRYELADVDVVGIDKIDPLDIAAARELDMVIRLVGAARLVDGNVDVRVGPALVDRHHPLAAVEGAFNAVMLQGDAIREITLEGPGAGGVETASAVIADMASVIGTMGTGFLQNDPVWRTLPRLAPGEHRSPFYFHLSVDDRPGRARARRRRARRARRLDRAAAPASERRRRRAARRHARGARRGRSTRRWRRSPRWRRSRRKPLAVPGRLRPRRCGARMGVIERYRDRLPVGPNTPLLTLGEGGTPLIRSQRLGERLGVELYFKFEGMNPTGSFKDRGMAVAVAKAVEDGADGIICASTGNTAASAAAYGARAGLTTVVLCPAGAIAARSWPSRAPSAPGCSRCAAASTRRCAAASSSSSSGSFALVNSLNPNRIEGQKTAAFEIDEQLGRAPDVLALPYGGGGNLCAYAKGFAEDGVEPSPRRRPGRASAPSRSPRRSGSPSPRTRTRWTRSSPPADTEIVSRHRRRDHRRLARARAPRGRLLRAVVGRRPGGARARRRSSPAAPSSASSPGTG